MGEGREGRILQNSQPASLTTCHLVMCGSSMLDALDCPDADTLSGVKEGSWSVVRRMIRLSVVSAGCISTTSPSLPSCLLPPGWVRELKRFERVADPSAPNTNDGVKTNW